MAVVAAASILYFFAPDQYHFYPRCMFYAITGLQCPGCGGLRAAHHLLHGDLAGAWRLNPLLVGLLPLAPVLLAWFAVKRESWTSFALKPVWVWGLVGAAVVFAVVRNLR